MNTVALPPPSLHGALGAWHFDPLMLAVLAAATAGYLVGVARIRRRGDRWPHSRTVAFVALGVGAVLEASEGWPSVYGPVLFWAYALQVTALLMVAPFLLALGRPVELARTALGPGGRARLDAVLASRPARLFTVPVVSPLLLAVVPFALFFSPLYPLTLDHPVLLPPVRLALLLIGFAVLVPLWEAEALGLSIPYALALLFSLIELLADALPGIVIRLDTHLLAAAHVAATPRAFGPSPLVDQQLGGDLLWCVGEAVDLPFLILLVLAWVRSDAREAARVDRLLDEAAASPASGPEGAAPSSASEQDDSVEQPWWQRDASVFGDRAHEFRPRP